MKMIGVVLLLLSIGGLAARYAARRADHQRLRELEVGRAPVMGIKRVAPRLPSAPTVVTCLRGLVIDHGKPVEGMQISVSDSPYSVSGDCPCDRPALFCGCREGLVQVSRLSRAGLVEAVKSETFRKHHRQARHTGASAGTCPGEAEKGLHLRCREGADRGRARACPDGFSARVESRLGGCHPRCADPPWCRRAKCPGDLEPRPPMRAGPFLLETGFLVALVNASDPAHRSCAATWGGLSGPFVTTEGVLVETAHMVRRNPAGFSKAWGLLSSVGTVVAAPTRHRFDRAAALMLQYADVPMDFVDATLVSLAEETGVRNVLTLDARGFDTYRTADGKKFKRLPV